MKRSLCQWPYTITISVSVDGPLFSIIFIDLFSILFSANLFCFHSPMMNKTNNKRKQKKKHTHKQTTTAKPRRRTNKSSDKKYHNLVMIRK
jgi:hypothetical protein